LLFRLDSWYISNWTEWNTIQGVIGQAISKLKEHAAQGQFEIRA